MDSLTESGLFLEMPKNKFEMMIVKPRGTYYIDYLVETVARNGARSQMVYYLICVSAVSRFVYAEIVNTENIELKVGNTMEEIYVNGEIISKKARSTRNYLAALRLILEQNMRLTSGKGYPIQYLIGDGESAFDSKAAWKFYDQNYIKFIPVHRVMNYDPTMRPRTSMPDYRAEGILNRVIRTLRDYAYSQFGASVLLPDVLTKTIVYYNTKKHQTLSKLMGIPLTPLMVELDKKLQLEIIRRERAHNQAVIGDPGYKLEIGDLVHVENPRQQGIKHRLRWIPGPWGIVNYKDGIFTVFNSQTGESIRVPRSSFSLSK
jgi:hypothetical protein